MKSFFTAAILIPAVLVLTSFALYVEFYLANPSRKVSHPYPIPSQVLNNQFIKSPADLMSLNSITDVHQLHLLNQYDSLEDLKHNLK